MHGNHPDLVTEVVRACPAGHSLVVRCHPLRIVAGRPEPFPTLFWLACDELHRRISRLEHAGAITRIEDRLASDASLAEQVAADHRRYALERDEALLPGERALLEKHDLLAAFSRRGIGGVRTPLSIKCLHLHYAHHLARGTVVGAMIEDLAGGSLAPCCAVERRA